MYYAALVALGVLAGAAIFSPSEASAGPTEKDAVVVRQPVVVKKPAAAVVHSPAVRHCWIGRWGYRHSS